MATVETNPNLGAQIVADAKEYVLYSWSVQSQINPIAVAGAEGRLLLGLRREALPRLRLAARQRQHRAPAPEDRRGDQGAGGQAVHDRAADGERVALPPRPAARGGHAGRSLRLVLHQRREPRRTRTRSSSRGSPPAATRSSRATARTTARRTAPSRSPAIRAAGPTSRACPASSGCSTRTRIAARPVIPIRARSARARRTSRRSSSTRARTPSRP